MLAILSLLLYVPATAREQIGAQALKGNTYRAKQATEIRGTPSTTFTDYAQRCITSQSDDTNITYYLSLKGEKYSHIQEDDSICEYSLLNRSMFFPELAMHTVYFHCDAVCCNMECCERDVPLSILGFSLLSFSALIILAYLGVCVSGLVLAWKNGSLCRTGGVRSTYPRRKRKEEATTTLTLISNPTTIAQ